MRDRITSAANPHLKHVRSLLRSRKQRQSERLFVAEGVRLVADVVRDGSPILVLYTPETLATTERGTLLASQLAALPCAWPIDSALLQALSDVEAPQGVLALARWPELEPSAMTLALVLDGVQDPGNVGTLLRSAEAAGASAVVCLPGTADIWAPKVVRAAMGAHLRLPLRQLDLAAARAWLHGLRWFAADLAASHSYAQIDWRQPAALVVGNEASGVDPAVLAAATPIHIPMLGHAESLNAAVAGSVILFEAARQRRD